jgi:iron donor protein CyaY
MMREVFSLRFVCTNSDPQSTYGLMTLSRSFLNLGVVLARYTHPFVRHASNSKLVSSKGHRTAHLPGTELTLDLIQTSPSAFNELADETLEHVYDVLDNWADIAKLSDFDIVLEAGVVTFSFGSKNTFVLNRQTAARELWLASPVSGPSHYNYCTEKAYWSDTRSGHGLISRLENDIQKVSAGTGLSFSWKHAKHGT